MTIERLQDVTDHAYNNIFNVMERLSIDCSHDAESIAEEIQSELESNNYYEPEVIYIKEAWDIVTDSSFNNFDPKPDFSNCETAIDCVYQEAREIVCEAYYSELGGCIQDVAEQIHEVIETILEIEPEGEAIDLVFTYSSNHGWAVHNRETESGIAIYDDKPGYYHPSKLEGELYAVERKINGNHVSACWNPSDYQEEE